MRAVTRYALVPLVLAVLVALQVLLGVTAIPYYVRELTIP